MFTAFHRRVGFFIALVALAACSSQKPTETPRDGGASGDGKPSGDGGSGGEGGGSGDSGSGIAPPLKLPAPTADITWAPTTTFLDESQVSLVKSIDTATGAIALDSKGVKAAHLDLSKGRIVVIYGKAMSTITGSTDDGTTLTLDTGFASLAQAATHAELDFQQATEWTPAAVMAAAKPAEHRVFKMGGGNTASVKYTAGAYSLTVDMTLYGDKADFNITGEKMGSGSAPSAKFNATGTVGRFVEHHHVLVDSGALKDYQADNDHIQGSFDLTAVAAQSGNDTINYSPTVPIFVWPGLIGPIPVQMTTSIQFVVNAIVPASASVDVGATVDYDSNLGFSFSNGSLNYMGSAGPYTIKKGMKLQSGAPGDVTFNAGIGFPRLAFSVFGTFADVWAQPAYEIGGSYTVFPACQTATAAFIGAAGYDLKIFGVGPSGSKEFWNITKPLLTSGMCGDAGGG